MTDRLDAALAELVAAIREEVAAQSRPTPEPERLLSVEQARQALGGMSRSTLYAMIRDGRLRTVAVGERGARAGRRLVPSSAIAELAAER